MPCRKIYFVLLFFATGFFGCSPDNGEIAGPNEVVYDYSLTDINSSSATYGENIGPGYFENQLTVHYFGHQYWGTCTARVGQLNALYANLVSEGINNVKIIAIGKEQYSGDNSNWILGNSIPIVADPSPNTLWTSWGASQWDVFFLDSSGEFITDFNIKNWNYNKVYNQIKDILLE